MKTYNGFRSWNAWNVSLWINNDEGLYQLACDKVNKARANGIKNVYGVAARWMLNELPANTPDGAKYNHLSVKTAIEGIE